MNINLKRIKHKDKEYTYPTLVITKDKTDKYRGIRLSKSIRITSENKIILEAMILLIFNGAAIKYYDRSLLDEATRLVGVIIERGWEEYV